MIVSFSECKWPLDSVSEWVLVSVSNCSLKLVSIISVSECQ